MEVEADKDAVGLNENATEGDVEGGGGGVVYVTPKKVVISAATSSKKSKKVTDATK